MCATYFVTDDLIFLYKYKNILMRTFEFKNEKKKTFPSKLDLRNGA